ncbi:hypothetical protein [Flavobacterium sp. KACC 22763]|uniref:hypothetical protein n=1 Tax=Flavobacterium sp. KACC 22763 TaxID=3025668 RepID=UPI00236649CC|nr:hypothetical protein [Flavobacterium sp. KACC 22763]WDF63392.1 hypothetical protein PQ463_17435 [Flavobacterium sp. KACC 22763]
MEKFEIDVKWGSYLFIINAATSILIALLMFLIDIRSLLYLSNVLIPVFIVQLLYFSIRDFKENRKYGLSKGFRKFFAFVRVLAMYFILVSFSDGRGNMWCFSLLLPYRKKDVSELSADVDSIEDDGITLNEFMATLKRKFSRS